MTMMEKIEASNMEPNKKEKFKKLWSRLCYLSAKIIQAKYEYYNGLKSPNSLSDLEYDKLEEEYKKLCTGFKVEPTATNMVGFNPDSLSGRLAMECYNSKNFASK